VLPPSDENWGAVRAETTRLNRLVDDLQRVSRAEAHQLDLHPTVTTADALVGDAIKAVRPAYASKGVSLEAALPPHPARVYVDPERLAEVLANLLANALRHTPAGGSVRVSAHDDRELIGIEIADTGEGIAAEHIGRIFERFYRVDPARSRGSGGTGIGLAIVRAIVEAHGGTVSAASEGIGRGATFTIFLPKRDSDASPSARPTHEAR
jgi:signal transduction histidine kinase